MRNANLQSSRLRVILSGNELEVYVYEKPIFFNFSSDRADNIAHDITNPEENRERSRHRAHKNIQRLIDANFGMWINEFGRPYISKFLTLTYAENIQDLDKTNEDFTLFMKRLNYQIFKSKRSIIKYLVVIEFQKRGAVHYHLVLFNLPYMDREIYFSVFEKAWGHGFVNVKTVPDRGVGRYITKYMTKSDDVRLRDNKSYFASRKIFRPLIIRDESFIRILLRKLPTEAQQYANAYSSEHTGMTEYRSFSLFKYPDLLAQILANAPKSDTFKANP